MKDKLVPIYFKKADDPDFATQLQKLQQLLAEEAEFLEPVKLGEELPETDGVISPEMLGPMPLRHWNWMTLSPSKLAGSTGLGVKGESEISFSSLMMTPVA